MLLDTGKSPSLIRVLVSTPGSVWIFDPGFHLHSMLANTRSAKLIREMFIFFSCMWNWASCYMFCSYGSYLFLLVVIFLIAVLGIKLKTSWMLCKYPSTEPHLCPLLSHRGALVRWNRSLMSKHGSLLFWLWLNFIFLWWSCHNELLFLCIFM